jgi:hypothetical protein
LPVFGRRAFRHEVRLYGDFDLSGNGTVHADELSTIARHHNEKFGSNQLPDQPERPSCRRGSNRVFQAKML